MNETDFTDWTRVDDEAERCRLDDILDGDGEPVYLPMKKLEGGRQLVYYKQRQFISKQEMIGVMMHLQACLLDEAQKAADPVDAAECQREAELCSRILARMVGASSEEVQ